MVCGVYAIIKIGTDESYIGSSVHIEKRFSQHRRSLGQGRHTSQKLQRAWNKYGSDSFEFKIIEACEPMERLKLEQFYLDTKNSCLNISKLASGGSRKEDWTKSRRSNLSVALTGNRNGIDKPAGFSDTMRAARAAHPSPGMTGRKHSAATIAKMCASQRANPPRSMLGRKHSPETILKMRTARIAKLASMSGADLAAVGRKISATKLRAGA